MNYHLTSEGNVQFDANPKQLKEAVKKEKKEHVVEKDEFKDEPPLNVWELILQAEGLVM